jgi:hypothetical protein
MGSGHSKDEEEIDLINEYQMIRREFNQTLGEFTIYKHRNSNQHLLVKERVYETQSSFNKQREMAAVRCKLNQEHILTLIWSKCNIFPYSQLFPQKTQKTHFFSKIQKFKSI